MKIVTLTPERRAELEAVNTSVNGYPYRSDRERYGREEFWAAIDEKGGDCEDYAIRKRDELWAMGWPEDSLNIAVCRVEGWGHAVLIAHTSEADLVLDNRDAEVRPMAARTEYEWRRITAAGSLDRWWRRLWLWFAVMRVRRWFA
jgi:predicted transglutaminase-like cysteine proteinase